MALVPTRQQAIIWTNGGYITDAYTVKQQGITWACINQDLCHCVGLVNQFMMT